VSSRSRNRKSRVSKFSDRSARLLDGISNGQADRSRDQCLIVLSPLDRVGVGIDAGLVRRPPKASFSEGRGARSEPHAGPHEECQTLHIAPRSRLSLFPSAVRVLLRNAAAAGVVNRVNL
jgi:hypothetical protein